MRVTVQLLAWTLASSLAHGATAPQTPAEGRLDLREIAAWLPGVYDNDPQRAFLEGMKRAADAPARAHLTIHAATASEPTPADAAAFDVELRHGSEHASVALQTRWELSVDPADRSVRMSVAVGDARRCVLRWTRHLDSFVGVPEAGCESAALGLAGDLRLGRDELWIDQPSAPVANKLYRAANFNCFIALRLRNGEPQAITGLATHDRGGTILIATRDEPARKLTLLLRRGLWPSNSGNNFVQLLSVYLYENGKRNALGNGWATPESGRVGFGVGDELPGGQNYSARCTRSGAVGGP